MIISLERLYPLWHCYGMSTGWWHNCNHMTKLELTYGVVGVVSVSFYRVISFQQEKHPGLHYPLHYQWWTVYAWEAHKSRTNREQRAS